MKPLNLTRQRGAAAIETAFILLYCFAMLPMALYFTRYTLHGAVAQQAVQNAARFMSTLPPEDMLDPDRRAVALAVAHGMVDEAVSSARLDTPLDGVEISCDALHCDAYVGSSPPATIHVIARLQFGDPIFLGYTGETLPQQFPVYETKLRYGY